ncbi:hypothetical protein QBC38DRAFT_474051 [Podospora fimiseda]|uniref:Uncharacterized protein n=1 Tax=Podospora fimiseda TaxID=252190 RepID=A0AAN7BSZ3_9PEZI|nr:hypothetical protein QBC38DRAFT_474051 [Podospora fimiseda]
MIFSRINFILLVIIPWSLTFIKISILAMYRCLFPTKFIRRSCTVLGGISLLWAFLRPCRRFFAARLIMDLLGIVWWAAVRGLPTGLDVSASSPTSSPVF